MARAHRHFVPGHIWHVTHRCHKREFLLKLGRDRHRWLQWLYQARKRYGLVILNYTVTSNHIHLILYDHRGDQTIPSSIQLVAGRTGQEYNQRKGRKGAYWEDRYHATIVERGEHLLQCIVYVDMNMVRAGVVAHPKDWKHGGYIEIQLPRRKNILIDYEKLFRLAGFKDFASFQEAHYGWVEAAVTQLSSVRESRWTESIAVGSENFLTSIKQQMHASARGRRVRSSDAGYELREVVNPYNTISEGKNSDIGPFLPRIGKL